MPTNLIIIVIISNKGFSRIKCLVCDNHFINIVRSKIKKKRHSILSINFVRHIKKYLDKRLAEREHIKIKTLAPSTTANQTKQTAALQHIYKNKKQL